MNPKKFGKIANHKQESWKAPLAIFIRDLYFKRFAKNRVSRMEYGIKSIEQLSKLGKGDGTVSNATN